MALRCNTSSNNLFGLGFGKYCPSDEGLVIPHFLVIPTKEESEAHRLLDSSFVGMTKTPRNDKTKKVKQLSA